MKKFGFGKKDDGDEGGRTALFGRKKESAPASDNPYAQQSGNDPYANEKYANMTPYQQARANIGGGGLPSGPRPGGGQMGLPSGPGPRRGPSPQPPAYNGGGPGNGGGYGNEKYGQTGGYGSNRYDNNNNAYGANQQYNAAPPSSRGPGGYGGLGRTNSNDTEADRDALFGGARDRMAQAPPAKNSRYAAEAGGYGSQVPGGGYGNDANRGDLFGGAQQRYDQRQQTGGSGQSGPGGGSYGGYGEERELTEEERERLEVRGVKQQIDETRNESLASVNRSQALAAQMNEVSRGTLARLGAQGERLYNAEKNLDLASNYNKKAESSTKDLDRLNGSMFIPARGNPFTSKRREQEREARIHKEHQMEREQREALRSEEYASNQWMESQFKRSAPGSEGGYQRSAPGQNSKYIFNEDDDELEDKQEREEKERQIDAGLDDLMQSLSMAHGTAVAMGQEVDRQNRHIDRIAAKSDAVEDGVQRNRRKLEKIK